jgi:putative tricarboxylic transport membrane protein
VRPNRAKLLSHERSLQPGLVGAGLIVPVALEKKISRSPERFGNGAIEGVAASHSKTQVDFIPTMTLGIPGDAVMALLLGALLIQGIQPGPQLMTEHPDLFWGLIASFWVGNVLLMLFNVR